ncbi:phosphopantetheine-binding protein [Streptomyces boluensis]|uniref:Acyl carrier protein n=1 Tax=Streptomyces boluensis TaxID=1775135 RepID=A0A964XKN8_9ACTN|nr:phosphopantetheine-binding protein [Streptomyces boluensis]NBE50738.1 acyl carrier protein [Streptomyces boluensis]
MSRTDEATGSDIDSVITRHVRVPFVDTSPLAEVGLDSLSVLRIAGELITDPEQEIDPTGLAAVRTVADLRQWLHGLLVPAQGVR